MPYARLIQICHAIRRARALEYENEWLRSAFIGYQGYLLQPVRGKHMPFGKYAEAMGIVEAKVRRIHVADDKRKAHENLAKIQEAMKKGKVLEFNAPRVGSRG